MTEEQQRLSRVKQRLVEILANDAYDDGVTMRHEIELLVQDELAAD